MKRTKLVSTFALTLLLAGTLVAARQARAQSGPYQYFAVSPCRAYDTRSGGGGAINSAIVRTFVLKGLCGIPQTALAASLNLTVTEPRAHTGEVRFAPTGGAYPNVSKLN